MQIPFIDLYYETVELRNVELNLGDKVYKVDLLSVQQDKQNKLRPMCSIEEIEVETIVGNIIHNKDYFYQITINNCWIAKGVFLTSEKLVKPKTLQFGNYAIVKTLKEANELNNLIEKQILKMV